MKRTAATAPLVAAALTRTACGGGDSDTSNTVPADAKAEALAHARKVAPHLVDAWENMGADLHAEACNNVENDITTMHVGFLMGPYNTDGLTPDDFDLAT